MANRPQDERPKGERPKLVPVLTPQEPQEAQAPKAPKAPKARKPIKLRPDLRERLKLALALQEHHTRLAAEQEATIASLLNVAFGIDIRRESWELDAQRGTLTPKE